MLTFEQMEAMPLNTILVDIVYNELVRVVDKTLFIHPTEGPMYEFKVIYLDDPRYTEKVYNWMLCLPDKCYDFNASLSIEKYAIAYLDRFDLYALIDYYYKKYPIRDTVIVESKVPLLEDGKYYYIIVESINNKVFVTYNYDYEKVNFQMAFKDTKEFIKYYPDMKEIFMDASKDREDAKKKYLNTISYLERHIKNDLNSLKELKDVYKYM